MCKVFVEYKIKPESRESYLTWMNEMAQKEKRLAFYEGSDQPGLFVELWDDVTYEEYAEMKERRLNHASSGDNESEGWKKLSGFVEGGTPKIHIWHFTKAN